MVRIEYIIIMHGVIYIYVKNFINNIIMAKHNGYYSYLPFLSAVVNTRVQESDILTIILLFKCVLILLCCA